MLEELRVRNLALIEDVTLEFGPGMTVLTGETGAGKTALVGALKLLVGERADSTLVRAGAAEAVVEGRALVGDREVVVRRRIGSDGRSRCAIDGDLATVGQLADLLGPLVDLHGQHEHQALLQPALHAGYLDRYIGEAAVAALDAYRLRLAEYRDALDRRERLRALLAEGLRDAEYARFVVDEIAAVAPREGEDDEIERRLPTLRHAEKLAAAAADALGALRDEGAAGDALDAAADALRRVAGLDPALDAVGGELETARVLVDEVGRALRAYGEGVEHDPEALNTLQARAALLGNLKKKYGPTLDDVLRTSLDHEEKLSAVESGEERTGAIEAQVEASFGLLQEAASVLVELRAEAAPRFAEELGAAAADLAMPGVAFDVASETLEPGSWTENGPQRVEFLFSPGAGQPARPLARIASGGEVSRVMLALKSVLGAADDVPVLVFDEVDTGIGGATATAVGSRLRELARGHQVLVVTHLAQVAAFADRHLVVEKDIGPAAVRTLVRAVEGEDRVAEIARMLSGADTDASRAHAGELLAGVTGR